MVDASDGEQDPAARKAAWVPDHDDHQAAGDPLQFDPEFSGPKPVESRGCADCCAGMAMVLYFVGMFGVLGYALIKGNYQKLLYGLDLNGDNCGMNHGSSKDYNDKKLLYWPDPIGAPSAKYCVNTCPDNGDTTFSYDGSTHWVATWDTALVLNRCLPDTCSASWSDAQCSDAKDLVQGDYPNWLKRFFIDCATFDGAIGIGIGLACCIAANVILSRMIRHAGSRLPKLVYLAAVTLLGGFGIMLLANTGNVGNSSVNTEFQQEDSFSYMTLFFGLLVLVYLGVLLGLGWHLNANNDKVELVMREVSEPFGAIPRFIHTPLFPTAIVVAIGIFWVLGAVLLLGLDSTALTVVLGGYQLYGLLVCLEVLYGLTVATVSGCVASWYWGTPDESLKVCSEDEISNSYFRVGLSSFGTVARCAFIMAVFRPVLSFLRRLRRCGSSGEGTPGCRHAAHTCCRCCLAVAESTKMMDNRAHIQMAVHGTDWADSKTLSYQIFYRNRGKVEFASLIASKMLFVVSAMNTVIAGLVTFVWLAYVRPQG
eukprot:TRINITY_DN8885_c0_g1_i7.p1 TRINITY_DN8885_c0_g1~~TRINITY_DN8885_c0_g1_i7.p1  ORF type:complete len:539 (+),score=119.32 TRINITY_DN8885_c0_g1_i7:50-1666(+)